MRAVALATVLVAASSAMAGFTAEQEKQLADATYVYVRSERKSGEWSKPAEIWFFVDGGTLYVGTKPESWRVKRIKAGRTKARVAIGKVDGPTFDATAAVVQNPALEEKMFAAYAKKYPEGWKKFEDAFRQGFKTGDRVLVAYTPR